MNPIYAKIKDLGEWLKYGTLAVAIVSVAALGADKVNDVAYERGLVRSLQPLSSMRSLDELREFAKKYAYATYSLNELRARQGDERRVDPTIRFDFETEDRKVNGSIEGRFPPSLTLYIADTTGRLKIYMDDGIDRVLDEVKKERYETGRMGLIGENVYLYSDGGYNIVKWRSARKGDKCPVEGQPIGACSIGVARFDPHNSRENKLSGIFKKVPPAVLQKRLQLEKSEANDEYNSLEPKLLEAINERFGTKTE